MLRLAGDGSPPTHLAHSSGWGDQEMGPVAFSWGPAGLGDVLAEKFALVFF